MGALGSDAAIEAADVVLMDDRPSKIALAVVGLANLTSNEKFAYDAYRRFIAMFSEMVHDRLKCNAVPIQLPIGAEADFRGIIDLVEMNARIYYDNGNAHALCHAFYVAPDEERQRHVAQLSFLQLRECAFYSNTGYDAYSRASELLIVAQLNYLQ